MTRRALSLLSCFAILALSCDTVQPTRVELPEVSMAPAQQQPAAEPVLARPARSKSDREVDSAIAYFRSKRSGLTEAEIERVAKATIREARRHDLDPRLVMAVIHVESRGNTFALSPAGAMGLMQIMPATGEELAEDLEVPWPGPRALFDPMLNVHLGTAYLKQLADRYGNTATALAAYNWGPGSIDRRLRRGTPLPGEYSDSVLAEYRTDRIERRQSAVPASYQH